MKICLPNLSISIALSTRRGRHTLKSSPLTSWTARSRCWTTRARPSPAAGRRGSDPGKWPILSSRMVLRVEIQRLFSLNIISNTGLLKKSDSQAMTAATLYNGPQSPGNSCKIFIHNVSISDFLTTKKYQQSFIKFSHQSL